MSHYVITGAGSSVLDFTSDKLTVTRDGVVEYTHVDAVTPPPSGGIPAGAILLATPAPGAPEVPMTLQPNQLYYMELINTKGSFAVTRGVGGVDWKIQNGLSLPENAGNWALLATIPMKKTTFPASTVYPYYKEQYPESAGLNYVPTDTGTGAAVVTLGYVYSFNFLASGPVSVVIGARA